MTIHPILALSPREKEAIALIREGLSNQQIAEEMGVTPKTIENHLYNASQKLNAKSRTQLVLILDGKLDAEIEIHLSYLNAKKLLKAKIKKLHKQGCSAIQISERTGVGYQGVYGHLARMGLPTGSCTKVLQTSKEN